MPYIPIPGIWPDDKLPPEARRLNRLMSNWCSVAVGLLFLVFVVTIIAGAVGGLRSPVAIGLAALFAAAAVAALVRGFTYLRPLLRQLKEMKQATNQQS